MMEDGNDTIINIDGPIHSGINISPNAISSVDYNGGFLINLDT